MLTKPQVFYDDTHKQALGYQNPFYLKKAQRIKPTLYDASVISRQHDVIPMTNEEETLILVEAPRELPKGGLNTPKAVFLNEAIPLLKTLKDIFNVFDKDILDEITKVQTVFNQMEVAVQQCSVDKQCFEIHKKELFLTMIDSYTKSCLKIYFENNDLKAQLQEKDTTINKLRNHIKSLRESDKKDIVKQDMDEIETINIELEHRVKSSTSASRSQPSGNTKNNRILRPPSSNMQNKVEDHPRSVKSKFTSTKVVHLKETTSKSVETQKPKIKVYSRKPKPIKSVGSSSKSTITNITEPNQSCGSNASDVPSSSSLVDFRFGNDQIAKIMGYGDYQLGNVTISQVYYVEGLENVTTKHHELLHNKKPDLSYLHVFGALCYPTNDSEDLGKLQQKVDIGIFVGYAPAKKAFQIYNIRTRLTIETIYVTFDKLTAMTSEQFCLGPGPQLMNPATLSSGLMSNPPFPTQSVPPTKKE
ncbi:hypothetical protein Tco_0070746 [Tanacetum coccineum]